MQLERTGKVRALIRLLTAGCALDTEDRPGEGGSTVAVADNAAVDQMNDGFSATYQANGAVVTDVWGAFESENWDVIQTDRWGTVPTNVARACDWTRFCTSADIHPNIAGYGVIAHAFLEAMA